MRRPLPLAFALAAALASAPAAAQSPPTQPAPPAPAPAPPSAPAPAAPAPVAPAPAALAPVAPAPAQPAPASVVPVPSAPPPGYGQPGYPPPAYGQPGYPPPAYGQPGYAPPPGAPQPGQYPPPGYGAPGYGPPGEYGYGYIPPPPPPPPPPPKPLRWSLRYDPFDLIMRRMTFEAEVAIVKFFALEVAPSWIFGSPYDNVDEKGFDIAANAAFYLSGQALRGFWLKGHFEYETYNAVISNPDPGRAGDVSTPQRLGSAIVGALFGDTWVIPRSGGFALSGGIGVGYATAPTVTLTTPSGAYSSQLYSGFDKVRLLGTVGLGVAF